MERKGKIIVLSAPSGTGKSTIIQRLMEMPELHLGFSISATCRAPRGQEQDGREYYFLTQETFAAYVRQGRFVEWEEVYPGCRYGSPCNLSDCLNRDMAVRRDNAQEHIWAVIVGTFFL